MTKSSDVTQLLTSYRVGDRSLIDELFPLIYDELHGIAHRILTNERSDHTLSTTELVHEAYFKMVDQRRVSWQDRAHFFAIAAQAMRRILVDYARRRNAKKRGGSLQKLPLDENALAIDLQAGLLVTGFEQLKTSQGYDQHRERARGRLVSFYTSLNLFCAIRLFSDNLYVHYYGTSD